MRAFLRWADAIVLPFGIFEIVLVTIIALRLLAYWKSFVFGWHRYRRRVLPSDQEILNSNPPHLKIQITTRGSAGSTEVILRGINGVLRLAEQAPQLARYFSVEVVTESQEQVNFIEKLYRTAQVKISGLVVPADFVSENKTGLKARGMHYAVLARRAGWNFITGRVFIVHFDEESVMMPMELRKLLYVLATTDKKILEGPIYYPLEYHQASGICRAMEANRPAGCFECRVVMEKGIPFHLHGSNLVVEEQLENEIGWDIGQLEGKDFIAEDFVFGLNNYSRYGADIFGWHGCVILEQPPFSFKSAFKQRHRWIFGVLQGLSATSESSEFLSMSWVTRKKFHWATRFRIFTFAAGSIAGGLSVIVLPLSLLAGIFCLINGEPMPFGTALTMWMTFVGALWLGTVMMGAWLNVRDANMTGLRREQEIARAVATAPLAGILESWAGLSAVWDWLRGERGITWIPAPKTLGADAAASAAAVGSQPLAIQGDVSAIEIEALDLPGEEDRLLDAHFLPSVGFALIATVVGIIYIISPIVMFTLPFIADPVNAIVIAVGIFYLGIAAVRLVLRAILTVPNGLPANVSHYSVSLRRQRGMMSMLGATALGCVLLIGLMIVTCAPMQSLRYASVEELAENGGKGNRVMLGAQLDWGKNSPKSFTKTYGKSAYSYGKFVDFPFSAESRSSVDAAVEQISEYRGILFLTLLPYQGLQVITEETMGQLTASLTKWNNAGTPVMVRFAHEMNGSWYPWSQNPAEYVPAFRKVAAAVHAAPHSTMVWSPNDGQGYPFVGSQYVPKLGSRAFRDLDTNHDKILNEADDPYAPYYPGDDVVDWVGLSLYHFGTTYPWGANVIPESTKYADKLVGKILTKPDDAQALPDFYTTYAVNHNKPMVISETSAAYNPENKTGASNLAIKRAWWRQIFSTENHRRFPRIKLINWFELEKKEADFGHTPIPWGVMNDFTMRVAFRRDMPNWLLFPPGGNRFTLFSPNF